METHTTVILLFAFQCIMNLSFCIWGTYEIGRWRLLLNDQKNEIEGMKRDIDNLGTMIRHNRASFEGKLSRFIGEVSARFNHLNVNAKFTYPEDHEH